MMAESSSYGSFSCPVIVILGSTGTGKSKLGIELGEKINGEIISADSMQVYKGLDIITNKVTKEEMKRCRHHMVNLVSPLENFDVVDFRNKALPLISELAEQGKIPIIVGGTNYYIEALIWDILVDKRTAIDYSDVSSQDNSGAASPAFAKCETPNLPMISRDSGTNIETTEDAKGDEIPLEEYSLYEELKKVDPLMASKLHPNNTRKISRSLEIFKEFGRCHSEILEQQKSQKCADFLGGPLRLKNVLVLWLTCEVETLNRRLSDRVDDMINRGLVDEISDFYSRYVESRTRDNEANLYTEGIFQSIGFKEFHPYLISKEEDENEKSRLFEDCRKSLVQATCRYARKQVGWVKNRFLGRPSASSPDVYELSTTNPKQWQEDVLRPALDIVKCFLTGSEIKYQPLPRVNRHRSLGRHKPHKCDVCNGRLILGEEAWESHCKSRSHRKRKAKRRKIEESESSSPC